ncbi:MULTISPECIES: oxidoreductase [Chromobacterium]|jgi:predicted homoserine dehydrogenase-like protein|uniref:Oxidoreductase n=2 Tax=Chromobacterium TaxID=535 RepID=A0A1S1XA56_9NEIS|nr:MULTISPECIES: oxidoreductase [Chromobacterium]KIA80499.1 oxidoreductase [Chromobacterium piscinae]MDE1711305.1 oxidoreductase [Chromobacterium amazonense]MDQ4542061.1 oxidoreductase [Chromobacterium amazonense]OHX16639.1 oxidoreductase [Chromobacterium amazonense]POB00446.1 oxidoreductase [Chromobacterium sinusclupearum]
MQKFRIGMVGVGETGTPLLKQLLDAPFVEMVGVADLDLQLPGVLLAKERGVPVTDNFIEIAEQGSRVDIIIDVTGSRKVREDLRRYMQFSGNTHTVIVHERVALLMLSLGAGRWVETRHDEMTY